MFISHVLFFLSFSKCHIVHPLILIVCGGGCSNVVVVLVCHGEERAEPEGEALDLPVSLRFYPHLWS